MCPYDSQGPTFKKDDSVTESISEVGKPSFTELFSLALFFYSPFPLLDI